MKTLKSTLLAGVFGLAGFFSVLQPALAQDMGISAREVLDRETLKAFVRSAKAYVEGITDAARIDDLHEEKWKFGSVYIYIGNEEGVIRWHGANAASVGQDLSGMEDPVTGALFVQELIAAARSGGGYVEYHFDDPIVIGDEDHTSPKLGYIEPFTSPLPDLFPGQNMVIGSGIYLGHQVALDFAHFGNGDAISSDIVLVNLAATPIRPAVYFYDKAGALIDPESVVDVGGNLEATDHGAVTLQSELAPLGEVTISTNGQGDTVTGSVKVISDGPESPIGGVLRFDVPGVGVAGVGASQAVRAAIFPARRQAEGIDTGAALRNLSEKELTLSCSLMMGGEVLEETDVALAANGQDAKFISEMFEHDTSDFTGSVRCMAGGIAQKFTGVAVELDPMSGIFTTLPVIPLDADAPSEEAMAVTVDILATDSGMALGSVLVEDTVNGGRFTPDLTGLTAGEHGFHVHENPDCGMAGQNAGGHYDPANTGRHEGPNGNGHLGDLPTLTVAEDGTATVPVVARRIRVSDLAGRSLMVHAGGDNYSDMPAPLGGGGARVACGVILAAGN